MNKSIKTLQTLIVQSGYDIAIDGIFGNQTRTAIERLSVPNWIKTAMKEVGVHEIYGVEHNDRIIYYHSFTGGYSTDEIAWCGSAVAMVMSTNGYELPRYAERAKSWLKFGKSSIVPVIGAIAVKSRSGGGHVCFVLGQNSDGDLYCLGGNQNDEVNIKLYKKDVFLDFRVPDNYKNECLPYYALLSNGDTREA